MSKVTQAKQVIEHVAKFGSITPIEAIRFYGITRLSGVVYSLKNTQHALKEGTRDGKMSVYVPDFDARLTALKAAQAVELHNAKTGAEAAQISAHYTALFMKVHQQMK
ncbi:TPA: helix-turn-helix domain-containing protein [Vibrio fluvialis]